ncbi:MAG: helix-turn-helix domain-containing protein [Pseudobdellovibrionaceae bacterium]
MKRPDLGIYLKNARVGKGKSQADVARFLRLQSPQSISDWERNYGSLIPLKTLKKLIKLYELDPAEVFEILLDYQLRSLEAKLTEEFYGRQNKSKTRSRA